MAISKQYMVCHFRLWHILFCPDTALQYKGPDAAAIQLRETILQSRPVVERVNSTCVTLMLGCRKTGSMTQTTHQLTLPEQAWHCCLKG